jgi:hypothetical protein
MSRELGDLSQKYSRHPSASIASEPSKINLILRNYLVPVGVSN